MNAFKRFVSTVPLWAFALVLLAIFVISVYLRARSGMQMYGATFKSENDHYIVDYVQHGGPIDIAGIRSGDTLVSLDMKSLKEWETKTHIPGPGDTVIHGILRNRRYFGEYLENFGISFRMEVPEKIPDQPVTPDFRRNAFYAWQEAIHNAVKHGDCSEVKFVMKMEGRKMSVTIHDNGKGFDQTKSGSGGNGLLNMKKRAEDLGGSFEIQSEAGKGTRVVFEVPIVL